MKCCFGLSKIKGKDLESLREIIKTIIKSYKGTDFHSEKVIGYEDIPIYIENDNLIQYGGQTKRLYYLS